MQRGCHINCTVLTTKLTLRGNVTVETRFEPIYSQRSIKFSCKFARKVEAGGRFIAGDLPGEEDEVVSIGYLSYSMNVQSGSFGGMTKIQIVSDHDLDYIYPR